MAEEVSVEKTEAAPALDEAKLAELIKQSQQDSIKAALAELQHQTQTREQPVVESQQEVKPDIWDEILEPRLNKTHKAVQQANFQAAAAADRADFYASEFWEEKVDRWLVAEDEKELKAEKRKIKDKLESTFVKLANEGRPLPRSDIAKHILSEYLDENEEKFHTTRDKKRKKVEEAELDKARGAVSMNAGTLVNVTPDALYDMGPEKILEKYGNLTF